MNHSATRDFARMVRALQETGLSQTEIARRTGASQATVSHLACGRGHEPRYSVGVALVSLYQQFSERGH